MAALNKPTNTEHNSVTWWMQIDQPQVSEDAKWIRDKEDLITLRPGREHAWLDASVEKLLQWFHCPLLGVRPETPVS